MEHIHHLGYLPQIVILLATAVFVVTLFKRLNLSPVLGYLVAGAIVGENGMDYVKSTDLTIVAEIGVVFLLFAIGLELTLKRLIQMRAHVFGFGSLQVILTSVVISFICKLTGLSTNASIIIGCSLALSSTAIVLRVLADSNTQSTQVGRLALSNLILQDLAVVPLLVMVPLLADDNANIMMTMSYAVVKAIIVLTVIFIVGRLAIRPLYKLISSLNSNELFLAVTLFVILGTSLITSYLGLSLAMGAFIAGLLVAETQYQHQVEENIMNFKGLLMGLFFMTVGMTIKPELFYQNIFVILSVSLLLLIVKALIIIVISRLFRFSWSASIHAGLLLSQGGEFAFILFGLAAQDNIGLLDANTTQNLLTIVTITMALTPALSKLGSFLASRSEDKNNELNIKENKCSHTNDLNNHVVIAGFCDSAEMVGRMLSAEKISYVVLESDAVKAKKASDMGFPVHFGDASKLATLQAVGISRARKVIVTVEQMIHIKKIILTVKKNYPDLSIVVRSNDLSNVKTLKKLGAKTIVPEKYEAGLQMAGALLNAIGMSEHSISILKNEFRAGDYKIAKKSMEDED